MNQILQITVIGIGATIIMDIYAYILKLFKITSLDYCIVGRWIGYMTKGKFTHTLIIKTAPYPYEKTIGWTAHYSIGIIFSFLLIGLFGRTWLSTPTMLPSLIIGLSTTIAPFLIMQPAFGFGIAGSKFPKPGIIRLKSIIAHLVYGLGLYITATILV
ncbi:DUF2938 domain-containing protein [Wenyingzhuangia sp. IMCC45574]